MTNSAAMRLDAYLSAGRVGSRSEVKKLTRKGKVTVDGVVVKDPATSVTRNHEVRCRGELVVLPPAEAHLILYKPVGHACSRSPDAA